MSRYIVAMHKALDHPALYFVLDLNTQKKCSKFFSSREAAYQERLYLIGLTLEAA